ncbi:phosphonate ABC transporter, permease protein PhnE [Elioraea thermophila]|uniref:phosphonate ABC transporter, permease protein PhnE n=1 Tax=Elioraea thermophila TaxID=2185104 RepID=UPI000DF20D82|nr:phosphonate ABC transporter, permease protein PhnE [Elioraea thermophila]
MLRTAAGDAAVARFEARYRAEARRKALTTALGGALFLAACTASAIVGEIDPARFAAGLPNIVDYVARTLPPVSRETPLADLGEWFWAMDIWLVLLADTVLMAIVGTLAGAGMAFLFCFHAAANLAPNGWSFFLARRSFELARTVPELVFALIFVYAFGPGPFAGVLAIAIHSAGALGKLFAEANENADPRPIEALSAAGATWAETMRFAVLPQTLPDLLSYSLLRFEINVRAASVLGIVGAGGIGEELYLVVRRFLYADISAIVLLILATVALIDLVCERLRKGLIEAGERKRTR